MNRIDRISAILIQLQSKKIVKAQDIAERFEISLRTVYRDVRTLEEAGVPVIGEAGIGYSLMEGYRLPPVMFTQEEAISFLTAEKLVEKMTDISTEKNYKSAMYKIKAVLKSTEKEHLENMNDHIEVIKNPYLPKDKHTTDHIQDILKSVSGKEIITIGYFANHSQENTNRNIEPVGIFFSGNNWYLIAWCQLRNDYRTFRIDRISSISFTNTRFQKEHPSLKTYLNQLSKEKELHKVIITVDKTILRHFGEQKYYNGFISQKVIGDAVEMTFLTSSLEGFARWYMMFGDMAHIHSPENLKNLVREISTKISKKIKSC